MTKHKEYSERIQLLLKTVVDECDKEDRTVRERQIRTWRKLKLFWEGFQNVWYSEVAHDWRIWDTQSAQESDQGYYDQPVNVFRAYLESIIAALSITVPPIKCYPDDADSPLDLCTARAGDKICQLVSRHNDVSLLWLHALFIYCTEGMIASYTYTKESKEYGTYTTDNYEETTENHELTTCPMCGYELDDRAMEEGEELRVQEENEFAPDGDDVELQHALNMGQEVCPACSQLMDPEIKQQQFIVTRLVNSTETPKSRICMEAYGGLNVKVPTYARNQAQCPYLIYSHEINYVDAVEEFDSLLNNEKLRKQIVSRSAGSYTEYDQWGRLSPQYQGEYPINVVTKKMAWIRPSAFNFLQDTKDIAELKRLFPNGACVTYINDNYACACNEALDDCWTLNVNPLADFVHYDPVGLLLVSIQDITNNLIALTTQTIEHGIPQTFADPGVLSFKAYEQTEVTPGGVFPATAKSGKSLSEGFYEVKTATLSQEVMPFGQSIQSFGQLVSGALPSLFGGQLEGSDTASEYSMSRAQALQRLQNTWKMLTSWWKNVFSKVVPLYIKEIQYDEREVQRNADGDFINVFIRRAELEGKIGKVELEANENLPLTWGQTKDIVMNLLNGNNPAILQFLMAPENLPLLREAIGLTDFYVPGEDDREQQYDEIKQLLNSTPIPTQDANFPEVPSVEIDPIYDNNQIHFEIVRKWAVSDAGRQAKIDNAEGYKNVLLHGRLHFEQIQMQQQQAAMSAAPPESGAPSGKEPKGQSLKNAPIMGEENVATVQ